MQTPQGKQWVTISPDTRHRQPLQPILPLCNHTDYRALGFIQDSLNHLLKVVQARPQAPKMDQAMTRLMESFQRRESHWQSKCIEMQRQNARLNNSIQKLQQTLFSKDNQLRVLYNKLSQLQKPLGLTRQLQELQQKNKQNQIKKLKELQKKWTDQKNRRIQVEQRLLVLQQQIATNKRQSRRVQSRRVQTLSQDNFQQNSSMSLAYHKDLQMRLNQSLRTIQILERQKTQLQLRLQQKKKGANIDQMKVMDMRNKLQQIQLKYREYQKSLSVLQAQKQKQKEQKDSQLKLRQQTEREFKVFKQRAQERTQRAKQKQTSMNQILRDLRSQFKTLQTDYNTKLKAKKSQIQSMDTARKKIQRQLQRYEQKREQWVSKQQQLQKQIQYLNQMIKQNQINERDTRYKPLQQKIIQLQNVLSKYQYDLQDIKLQNFKLTQTLAIKQSQIKHLMARILQGCNTVSKSQSRVQSFKSVASTRRQEHDSRIFQSHAYQMKSHDRLQQLQRQNAQLLIQVNQLRQSQNFSFSEGMFQRKDQQIQTQSQQYQDRCYQLQSQIESLKGMLGWYTSQYQKLAKDQSQQYLNQNIEDLVQQ